MNIEQTNIPGLQVIKPRIFADDRGYFFESYNQEKFSEQGVDITFVQDNQSKSSYGVVRGLHYQLNPKAQTKLVRVLQGSIFDVAVDIRLGSPTFLQWFGIELSEENKKQFLIPQGFAHGFSVLSETAVVLYKCDNLYAPELERGINYSDTDLSIDWQIDPERAIVSEKDQQNPAAKKAETNFHF